MRLALAPLWLILALLCGSNSAVAHAALVEARPGDGAILAEAPAMVRLRFNEPVSPLTVSLIDAQGRQHRALSVSTSDAVLDVEMPPDLPRGSHVLSYRVVSGDGHPVGGSLVFSLGARTGVAPGPAMESSPGVHGTLWLVRLMFYLGLFAGPGGVFFLAWVAPNLPHGRIAHATGALLLLGAAAAALSLGLEGLDALGQPLSALGASAAWAAGYQSSFRLTVAAGMAALLLGSAGLRSAAAWQRRGCSLAALSGVGLALALSGHASVAVPQWLARPAVFLHAVGVAYWVGALVPLAMMIRQAPSAALPSVRRFSNGALWAVAILTLAGLALATIQLKSPADLVQTAYGRILAAKAALVAALLGLAALNRLRLTPALATPSASGDRTLVRSVVAEIGLVMGILALAGLWRFTPPPAAPAPVLQAAASSSVHLHGPRLMAQVTLQPESAGATRATIVIAPGRTERLDPREVTLVLKKSDAGIEAIERPARKVGAAVWQVDGLVLPSPGPWRIGLEILVDDFDEANLEGTITVRP